MSKLTTYLQSKLEPWVSFFGVNPQLSLDIINSSFYAFKSNHIESGLLLLLIGKLAVVQVHYICGYYYLNSLLKGAKLDDEMGEPVL